MIPLPFMVPTGEAVPYRLSIASLEDLLPGLTAQLMASGASSFDIQMEHM